MTLPPNALPPAVARASNLPPIALTGLSSRLDGTRSMTGFAQYTTVLPDGAKLTLEMRAVNSRFLDVTIKFPDGLRPWENHCRNIVTQRIKRGKVELKANLSGTSQGLPTFSLDPRILDTIAALSAQVKATIDGFQGPTLSEILALQERLLGTTNTPDSVGQGDDEAALNAAVNHLIHEFDASRANEGQRLSGVVLEATKSIRAIIETLLTAAPNYVEQAQFRLSARFAAALEPSLLAEEAAERIRQEVAALGLRADVAEEMNRLLIHCEELASLMQPSPGKTREVGKRLDFLCQELNREANTLGSKAVSIDLTNASIELKLLIEQIREQAQNFE